MIRKVWELKEFQEPEIQFRMKKQVLIELLRKGNSTSEDDALSENLTLFLTLFCSRMDAWRISSCSDRCISRGL